MLSRLTYAKTDNVPPYSYIEYTNVYDKAGNLTDYIYDDDSGDVVKSYDFNGQLVTGYSDQSKTVNWDLNGRQASRLSDNPANYKIEYNWDGKLRKSYDGSANRRMECIYMPENGARIAKKRIWDDSTSFNHRYILDITGSTPKVLLVLDAANNNAILTRYVHTNREVLMQQDVNTTERYFYLHDRLGSVRLMIDDTGTVVNSYTYDPYGKAINSETQETVSNDYRFAGYFWDDEMGMYYCNVRYYHPELMRFTSRDSAEGDFQQPLSLHKYLYCENEPINGIDPLGLWTESIHRSFGSYGWGYDSKKGFSLFDYARLDIDKPALKKEYRKLHFMSKHEAAKDILAAIASGDTTGFEYGMHEFQDNYTHHGMSWHIDPSVDEMDWSNKAKVSAYRACDRYTRFFEGQFLKANINVWMTHSELNLPTSNASLSVFDSWSSPDTRTSRYFEPIYRAQMGE